MKRGNLYSASDKALFDALNQAKVTNDSLRQLFMSRGIVISSSTPRGELAIFFSRLTHDYYDYALLADLFGSVGRREKNCVARVIASVPDDVLSSTVVGLRDSMASPDVTATVRRVSDGFEIHAKYRTYDFNRSEFKQIVDREAIIGVENKDGIVTVRAPRNSVTDNWRSHFVGLLQGELREQFVLEELSLEHLESATLRTRFFRQLIADIDGFGLHDVTDVFVFNPDSGEDSEDQDDIAVSQVVHIDHASLRGRGVLESEELDNLYRRGFYIFRVVWQVTDGLPDSDIAELEALFEEPKTFTKFSYLAKGRYAGKGNGEHSKTRTHLEMDQEKKFNKRIEEAAYRSVTTLISLVTDPDGIASNDEDEVA